MIRRWVALSASGLGVLLALALVFGLADFGTAPGPGAAISHIEACAAPAGADIAGIASGGCRFVAITDGRALSRGFARSAFWLRLTVDNPDSLATERWLRVGHPRLESVTLFAPEAGGDWSRLRSGLATPLSARAVPEADPIFPLHLAPASSTTYFVQVRSDTAIDLSTSLWEPETLRRWTAALRAFQAASYGALLFSALLTLLLFGHLGGRVFLYFSACLLSAAAMDASYTGFIVATLWPANLVFDIRLQALASGLTASFLLLFLKAFLPRVPGDTAVRAILRGLLVVMGVVTLAACLVDYGLAVPVQAITGIVMVSLGCVLAILAYRRGGRPAGFLIGPFALLASMMLYRQAMALGLFPPSGIQQVGFAWCFVLVAPSILIGVIERAETVRRAAAEARSEAQARMRLTAEMSHELRAPLGTISGYARLLRYGNGRTTPAEASASIETESRRLLVMVDELLDFARGEVGQLTLAPAPILLAPFLAQVKRSATLAVAQRGSQFRLVAAPDLPPAILVDAGRLRQVLDNLIGNAARYTERGEVILTLSLAPERKEGKRELLFDIADTGIGLPPGEEERIFEPFHRGSHAAMRVPKGAGIGLALSRQLVTLMGGTITAANRAEGGSRFRFTIVAPSPSRDEEAVLLASAAAADPAPPDPAALAGLRDLVEQGAVSDIEIWLELFVEANPDQRAFYAALSDALLRLDFAALRELVGLPREGAAPRLSA